MPKTFFKCPKRGLIIRMAVSDIKQAGRNTQGVKLINIRDNDSIASVSVVAKNDEEEITETNESSDTQESAEPTNLN